MFFAIAETRAAFPGAWRLMTAIVAEQQATQDGYRRTASRQALATLCDDVLHKRADCVGVERMLDGWIERLP